MSCKVGFDVIEAVQAATDMPASRRRDLISAVTRIAKILGCAPATLKMDIEYLRASLDKVRPAAHDITRKSFSNIRSDFSAALALTGVTDRVPRGAAKKDARWKPLVDAISTDKRRSNGLALFANWCAQTALGPDDVTDHSLSAFLDWLLKKTIYRKPKDLVRRIPNLWNECATTVDGWPKARLKRQSFRSPTINVRWGDLPASFRRDAERYFDRRTHTDLFDSDELAPTREITATTLRLQRDHIRLAASVLIRNGLPLHELVSLASLTHSERLKSVLRSYTVRTGKKPNAFAISLARTILSVARYHVRVNEGEMSLLRAVAGRLTKVPYDLTEKNKQLLQFFDSEARLAALFNAPLELIKASRKELASGRLPLVQAQCAIAIELLLVAPVRPQNLARLNLARHFSEPNGPNGGMRLLIPAGETKTRKKDLIFEIPEDVAQRIRWYWKHVLAKVNPSPSSDLFVTLRGTPKHQETISLQLTLALRDLVGVDMTPHQFRHLAAKLYLEERPEGIETIRALLGHSFLKTTHIYAGDGQRRASRAYGSLVMGKRADLIARERARRALQSRRSRSL